MIWTVVWKPAAERALTDLWLQAADRQPISDAANRIDQLLKHFPATVGESRDPGRRILIEEPLAVVYTINSGDRMVTVLAVWQPD
jgi:plasmid stabilization system protein ParE